ncbi:N-6 DNA methylase [Aliarcobacter trophiarum LMG 25534]|uniref:site-specific DNA-methyltransferase (adenine-specific) n=1 Tax=Aliarcobacter trophiarum LMG 25534 TaxID=1032241 RepID=A0AAD0QIF5_9BACT|nr:N-6 DNA methylase [Aliarcobacter trophiarum]AXK48463.1 type II DNA methyltransferase [Aliarcobacter trophiarum LMG 25534]RXJ90006.1 N-6 DNA methylase [Aliarcobacter trophiarum LMG 25534]
MNKQIKEYLKNYSNDLNIVNKLIVSAYLEFNNLKAIKNKHILELLSGNDKKEIDNFLKLIYNHSEIFSFEDVINLFEITIPSSDIVVNGAIYTPKYIRDYIINNSVNKLDINERIKIADIACGSGAFLYTVAKYLKEKTKSSLFDIYKKNIFGLDIAEYAIERTKILLTLYAITLGEDIEQFEFNLFSGNALSFDWNEKYIGFNGFDSIVGNPPYVRTKNLDNGSKSLLKNWKVANSGNPDLYIPFFEIGIKYLKENGYLGYITINTFKKSVNARELRKFLNKESLKLSILDFGSYQIFDNKMTYTCIVLIQKNISEYITYAKISPDSIKFSRKFNFTEIDYNILDDHKGWLLADENIFKNINIIENTGIPLGRKNLIKNGIATLQNSLYIFKPYKEDKKYFYMEYNNEEYKIERAICRDIIKPNKLKTSEEIEKLTEKIIFPYNVKNRFASVIDESFLESTYPYTYKYLLKHKDLLLQRDKNKDKKYKWFEFGRSQSINDYGKKLLFPYMSNKPYFVYTNDENLMFYAGYAIYGESEIELKIIEKILKSKVFWYYIEHTSKPYSSKYFALAKNYVKDFGICELTDDEKVFLLKQNSKDKIDNFLISKYGILI